MEEFKTRLMEEAIELRSRLTLIYNFINGDNKVYKKLPFKIKCYIKIQCFAMMLYNKYLKKRMDWLEITNEHLDDFYVEETARKYLQNLKAKNYDKIVNNERKSKKMLMEINQLIADAITYKQTNEQWFLDWMDQINRASVLF